MLHHIPLKALRKTSGCAACSTLYMQRLLASMRISTINTEDMIDFFFSYKTVAITLKESYLAFRRNRWKIQLRGACGRSPCRKGKCRNDGKQVHNSIKRYQKMQARPQFALVRIKIICRPNAQCILYKKR